ncbi:maleylpyruvate isomerase N-terminal domain-containing protein [Mycobacterium sp. ITM-2016-00318]|uniref:maleylpyruvate isomerase N-terminal domain-containing protein n=1 Tax=Mycobacterium sp. ITM-2016-00318 TaxID=2099693 RepID=UPI000CF8E0E5|nr:maleylpyruvate isomerase N-terminal domain-containing protein [Mycobacterium sp. ITM-2016-00318]WNG90686.1 maleylpyruvate isomerase N-terminal domain-containing protein [Mycobacterium sp. ITM-2016-00318]
MTSTSVHTTGPVEETRRAHDQSREALRTAAGRIVELLRRIDDAGAPVPGLAWTAAETAAHMVGDLRDYARALTRHTGGYMTHANRPQQSPSRLSAAVNARHLEEVPERDLGRLADLIDEAAAGYLAAVAVADERATIPTPNGLTITPPTMTTLLLGEQVVHGLDIARAARIGWQVDPHDALLITPGVLAIAPQYLRRSAVGTRASFELRIRGAKNYRLAVDGGTAVVTDAVQKSDCVITADPVAFLLLGYGRISQWSPIMRGKLRPGGRKPWLAMKFATLLDSP